MLMPIAIILSFCSFFTTSVATHAKPIEIVEVIQSIPTTQTPTWQIGDVQDVIDATTQMGTERLLFPVPFHPSIHLKMHSGELSIQRKGIRDFHINLTKY